MQRKQESRHEWRIDYDERPLRVFTREERGVLALWQGLDTYTRECAPLYADACAAIEFRVGELFDIASGMLNYAPDSLRRGALSEAFREMMRAWHIDPDTGEWAGE